MNRKARLVFIFVLVAVVAIAIAIPTYAVWSGGADTTANGVIDNNDDMTYRYLVLDGITSQGKHYYMTYNDAGYFEYNASYNIYDEEVDTSATALSSIGVIGYTGMLGEYEDLIIPDSITWKDSSSTSHDAAEIDFVNMLSELEFPALRGIKSVVIGANVEEIQGVSFSFLPLLTEVKFKMSLSDYNNLTISENAFISKNTITRKYYNDGDYVTIS